MRVLAGMTGLALAMLGLSAADAATLIPIIPPPGTVSGSLGVSSINDHDVIAGSYGTADGGRHAFFGPLNGQYTSFDHQTHTSAVAINNKEIIVGGSNDEGAFERLADGTFLSIEMGHTLMKDGELRGLNNKGVFMGRGAFKKTWDCFFGRNGKYIAEFTTSLGDCIVDDMSFTGINDANAVVGSILTRNDNRVHGFISQNGAGRLIDYPDDSMVSTTTLGINNDGLTTGYWADTSGQYHAFKFDSIANTFTPLLPKEKWSVASGINQSGLIVLMTTEGYFIYCEKVARHCPTGGAPVAEASPIRVAPDTRLNR